VIAHKIYSNKTIHTTKFLLSVFSTVYNMFRPAWRNSDNTKNTLLTQYCAGGKIEKNEMGGACVACGGREKGSQGSGGET